MRLWLLRPTEDNPLWDPWYDKTFGMVVRAETEEHARNLAARHDSFGEELPHRLARKAWLSPANSTCVELTSNGEAGVVATRGLRVRAMMDIPECNARSIIETYLSGSTLEQTGKAHSVSYDTVRRVLIANGIKRRPSGTRGSSHERVRSIIEMYLGGESTTQIGLVCGISSTAVRQILIRNNIELRPRGRTRDSAPSERNRAIIMMYQSGKTLEQTGDKYGITRERVRQILRRNGIESRTTAASNALRPGVAAARALAADVRAARAARACARAERERAVIATYLSGKTLMQTGAEHGMHWNVVRMTLIRHGIPRRSYADNAVRPGYTRAPALSGQALAERDRAVIATYLSGKSLVETGAEHGMQFPHVRHVLMRHGIPRRSLRRA